ncbi:MAG: hypothetical protein KDD82_06600 [Planctomycetes bacterium]|nr:hypothetical protein [Planctomycetota bacterium]
MTRRSSLRKLSGVNPPPQSERMERRILQVCDASGSLVEYWGFKSIMGRVWTLLALRGAPMHQTRVADTLGVSRSLVSGTITDLMQYGLVRAVGEGRNAPYEAVVDVWPAVTDVLRTREWILLEKARLALEAALEEVQSGPPSAYSEPRIRFLLTMVKAVQGLLNVVLSVRRPGAAAGLRGWVSTMKTLIESLRTIR